ncbi:MAG: DUF3570 domain-containing protein [Vicinamibacteria bacterium]
MQLDPSERSRAIRTKLRAAACLLLAATPRLVQAADPTPTPTPAAPPTTQIDVTGLFYTERIRVLEPTLRYTRIYSSGRSFFGQLSIDSVTGASPSGALPTGQIQTVTSASGQRRSVSATGIPTTQFGDTRFALDAEVHQPAKMFAFTLGGHFSREKDYQSAGVTGGVAIDLNRKLTTLTLGGGYNSDSVSPKGGISVGLAPFGTLTGISDSPKHVKTGLIGLSQVLTRRWLFGVTGTIGREDGYLTDPYKALSVVNASTGVPISQRNESRPETRERKSVQADSVYHLTSNVLYLSYRRYWDDWGVRSNTVDGKYRFMRSASTFIEPHVRYYNQTAADFYRFGLVQGAALPKYATSDYRMSAFQGVTLGATVGFIPDGRTSEWTVRAEYLGQFGNSSPPGVFGAQTKFDLFPKVNVFSVVVSYRFNR